MKVTEDRYKSYVDKRRRPLEFQVGDHVFLKVSLTKGYYQSLWSREEQNPEFWKEVAIAFIKEKHNTETSRNSYPITIY